jgi:hypothetical protein
LLQLPLLLLACSKRRPLLGAAAGPAAGLPEAAGVEKL